MDGVPYAVDEALMRVESLRLGAYVALGGKEGVGSPGDFAVLQRSAGAAGSVRVMPGGVAMLNRALGSTYGSNTYLARNAVDPNVPGDTGEVVVTVSSVSSGGARSDLVAVVLEDPNYAGQPAPASLADGPYAKVVVYEGAPATATRLEDVDPGQTGYALARIDRPAGTTTVTQAQIIDLRKLANPRTFPVSKMVAVPAGFEQLTSATPVAFPDDALWSVAVPVWARRCHVQMTCIGLKVTNDADAAGTWGGVGRATLGATSTAWSYIGPPIPAANGVDRAQFVIADEILVPKADRGTTKNLFAQCQRNFVTGGVQLGSDLGTVVAVHAVFVEDVDIDMWV